MENDAAKARRKDISRRRVLKRTGAFAAAGAVTHMPFIRTAQAATEINMLSWYGYAEPDIVAEFEAANNVKFKPKYYTGGDNMLALISQSPPGTYDLILADAEYVQQLKQAGYIEKLDPTDYPIGDYWPEFQKFPGHWSGDDLYSVMVRFGFLGIAYNTTVFSEADVSSYRVFWDSKLTGKLGHFDWHLPNLGQISLLNGNEKPFDVSAQAWKGIQETARTLRPQVGGFFDYGGTFSSLKNGQMSAFCGIGDWITGVLEKNGASVTTAIPKEGGLQWTESFSIGKGTRYRDIAREFIRYITSPAGQVKAANMVAYPAMIPNKKGWSALAAATPEEARRQRMELGKRNVMDDIREGLIRFRALPANQSLEDWNDFWSEYKNA